jgi:hypothetical protein
LGCWNHVKVGYVIDVSEENAASTFTSLRPRSQSQYIPPKRRQHRSLPYGANIQKLDQH